MKVTFFFYKEHVLSQSFPTFLCFGWFLLNANLCLVWKYNPKKIHIKTYLLPNCHIKISYIINTQFQHMVTQIGDEGNNNENIHVKSCITKRAHLKKVFGFSYSSYENTWRPCTQNGKVGIRISDCSMVRHLSFNKGMAIIWREPLGMAGHTLWATHDGSFVRVPKPCQHLLYSAADQQVFSKCQGIWDYLLGTKGYVDNCL